MDSTAAPKLPAVENCVRAPRREVSERDGLLAVQVQIARPVVAAQDDLPSVRA